MQGAVPPNVAAFCTVDSTRTNRRFCNKSNVGCFVPLYGCDLSLYESPLYMIACKEREHHTSIINAIKEIYAVDVALVRCVVIG